MFKGDAKAHLILKFMRQRFVSVFMQALEVIKAPPVGKPRILNSPEFRRYRWLKIVCRFPN